MLNFWLAIADSIHNDIADYIGDRDNYSGNTPEADINLFIVGIPNIISMLTMYKPFNSTRLYSFYSTSQDVIDFLLAEYPSIEILGSWGTDGILLTTLSNDLLNYMPDVFDEQTQQFVIATDLTDVNLLLGQTLRSFS